MSDVIVRSWPADAPGGAAMPEETLDRYLTLLSRARRREVRLHGDWSASGIDPAWLAGRLHALGLRATIACRAGAPLEALDPLWKGGAGLSVELANGSAEARLPERLPSVRRAEVFVPLATPATDLTPLWVWLDSLATPPSRARLAVGWTDGLSGPLPLAEQDGPAWGTRIEDVVRELTRRRVETELACGFPLCHLSREALGRMVWMRVVWPVAICPLALALGPDGLLRPCLRLPAPERFDVRQIPTLDPVDLSFQKALGAFRGLCSRAEGLRCRSAVTGACGTGCLEHELGAWHSSPRRAAP